MAINFTDFSSPDKWAQNNFEGISNFLPNILKGYQTARAPEQMNTDLELKKATNSTGSRGCSKVSNGWRFHWHARQYAAATSAKKQS